MSVEQLDKIDAIATQPDGNIVLAISDHLHWNGIDEHLLLLQNKINAYLVFIEGGQVYQDYPKSVGRKFHIAIKAKYPPMKKE